MNILLLFCIIQALFKVSESAARELLSRLLTVETVSLIRTVLKLNVIQNEKMNPIIKILKK